VDDKSKFASGWSNYDASPIEYPGYDKLRRFHL
jgi:hypothetical protein